MYVYIYIYIYIYVYICIYIYWYIFLVTTTRILVYFVWYILPAIFLNTSVVCCMAFLNHLVQTFCWSKCYLYPANVFDVNYQLITFLFTYTLHWHYLNKIHRLSNIILCNKRSVLRRQCWNTNQNIKMLVYWRYTEMTAFYISICIKHDALFNTLVQPF